MVSFPRISLEFIHHHQGFFLGIYSAGEDQVSSGCGVLSHRLGWINSKRIESDFEVLEVLF